LSDNNYFPTLKTCTGTDFEIPFSASSSCSIPSPAQSIASWLIIISPYPAADANREVRFAALPSTAISMTLSP
jgi:hypothetical protein